MLYHPLYEATFKLVTKPYDVKHNSAVTKLIRTDHLSHQVIRGDISSNHFKSPHAFETHADPKTPLGTLFKPDVQAMSAVAVPSHFGKGPDTVFDTNVRDGKELKHGVHFQIQNEEEFMKTIKRETKHSLLSKVFSHARDIKYKISKIAIYEEGGHFTAHRDTAYAANHQGTMLVALNSDHTGGDLVFTHPGSNQRLVWATSRKNENKRPRSIYEGCVVEEDMEVLDDQTYWWANQKASKLQWVAFVSSTMHEVLPVESGVRMVMQFDLYITPKDGKEADVAGNDTAKIEGDSEPKDEAKKGDSDKAVNTEKNEDDNNEDGDRNEEFSEEEEEDDVVVELGCDDIVIVANKASLHGKYEEDTLQKIIHAVDREFELVKVKNADTRCAMALPLAHVYPYSSITPEYLLPLDRSLFDAFIAAGYHVQLVATITTIKSDHKGSYKLTSKQYGVEQISKDAECFVRDTSRPSGYRSETFNRIEDEKIVFLETKRHDVKYISETEYSEYTGNESCEAEHKYYTCAMVLRKPTSSEK